MTGITHIEEINDGDDWVDLEKTTAATLREHALATVNLSATGKEGKDGHRYRAMIFLRREAAEWLVKNGPRFKIQVGGAACNKVRIVADAKSGRFESHELKGVQRIILGLVNLWPNEKRERVEARVDITDAHMVLTLPEDFAKATQPATPKAPAAAPAKPAPAAPFPITTRAAGLEAMAAAARRRVK